MPAASSGGRTVTEEDDRARSERLYAQNCRDLLAYFLRRTDPDDAADLLAETFLFA